MHLNSFLSSIVTTAVCVAIVGKAQAQDAGAVAALYEGSTTCDPANRLKSCTSIAPNRCCADIRRYAPTHHYHSASMHGIDSLSGGDAGWSIGIRNQSRTRAVSLNRNGCLSAKGGEQDVRVAVWDFCKDRPEVCATSASETENPPEGEEEGCLGFVTPDVVFIKEKAGEPGRPFAKSGVLEAFEGADVVDWDTMTVKEGKLELYYGIIGDNGDGLSHSQIQAMKVLAEEDAKRGMLSTAMERFLPEGLSLDGQQRASRSSDEL